MATFSQFQHLALRAFMACALALLCALDAAAFKNKDADISLFNHDKYVLEPHMEIFEDVDNQLTIKDILANEDNIGFEKNQRKHINYSFTNSTIWIRFDVDYPVHSSNKLQDRTWYLEIERAALDTCEFYIVNDDNSFEMLKADTSMRQEERLINSSTSVFPFDLRLSDRKRIYVKLKTIHAFYFHVNLWRPEAFIKHTTQLQLSYGFFYGGMGIIIVYNLFHFFATRNKNYLFYISYMGSITLLEFIELGHGIQITENLQDYLHKKYIPSIGWFCWASILLFTMSYLETGKHHPNFHFVLKRLLAILIFNIIIDPFVSYQTSVFALVFFSAICLILIPSLGVYTWRTGNPNGEYFTYANIFAIIGIIVYCLITMDVLPASNGFISLFSLGILAEALLFSLAIGNGINRAQQETIKSNQAALESLSRYQSLFENANEGMYQMDLQGNLIASNHALARILGYPDSNTLLSDPDSTAKRFFQASGFDFDPASTGNSHRAEFSFANHHNKTKWVTHSANPMMNSIAQTIGYEGIVIDITDSKERESVQKATIEESYRKELAAKESTDMTHFLANMSYRIRASLNTILGYAEIQTLNSTPQKTKKDTANKGLNQSNRLLSLINKILDFSKLEANKMDVESLPCQLSSVIYDATQTTETTRNTHYEYPFPSSCTTDPVRLGQCIEETLAYSVENSIKGQLETTISCNQESAKLVINIVFTPLITTTETKRLTSFKQKNAWQSTPSHDSGLGLALANNLANLLGGNLTIDAANETTHLKLELPISIRENSAVYENDAARLKDVSATIAQQHNNPLEFDGTILVAEDNPVNQKLIEKLLQKLGATVRMANDGKEAVDIANGEAIDLIFMDLNMPVMDGFAAAGILIAQHHPAPIYALTADNTSDIIDKCLSAGFTGHLDKPIKKQIVMDVLKQHQDSKKDNS